MMNGLVAWEIYREGWFFEGSLVKYGVVLCTTSVLNQSNGCQVNLPKVLQNQGLDALEVPKSRKVSHAHAPSPHEFHGFVSSMEPTAPRRMPGISIPHPTADGRLVKNNVINHPEWEWFQSHLSTC